MSADNPETVRALLVRPGEEPRIAKIPTGDQPAYEAVRGMVGGTLEVFGGGDWHAYSDEDYIAKDLPVNVFAARLLEELEPGRGRAHIRGPVVFLGTGEHGKEYDVPSRIEDLARRMTAGSLLAEWTDDGAIPLAPAAGKDAQLLQVAASIIRQTVISHGWKDVANAVPCVRVGQQVLERLGHTAVPVPVGFMALSELCAQTGGRQGHCIGVLGTGQTDPHGPNGGSWDGHLVLLVDGVWLLDIAAPMFDRPAQGIRMPEAFLARLPEPRPGGLAAGARLAITRRDGSVVRYTVNALTSWRDMIDWAGRSDRVEAATMEALRLLGPYTRMDDDAYGGEQWLKRPWYCATCHQGVRRMNLPDGTVQYAHARPWEVTDGHPVMPEQIDDITKVKLVCDFCLDPDPVWAYTGPNIIKKSIVSPLTGQVVAPGKEGLEGLGTLWSGCNICDRYVLEGDLEGLAASVLRSKANRGTRDPHVIAEWRRTNMARWQQFIPNITRRRLINPPALDPINPRNMPRIRNRLIRFLSDENFSAFGSPKVMILPGPDAGFPDDLTVMTTNPAEDVGEAYCARIVRGLELAELYHVSEDFTGLALSSGADLTDLSVTPEELPSPHGMIMWQVPIMTADARHTPGADEAQIICASWTTISGLGVWINWYVRTDQINPGNTLMREAAGLLLPWANGSGLRFGEPVKGTVGEPEDGHPAHDPDGMGSFRTLLATWFLINQPGVAQQQVEVTNDKQLIKRARREGRQPPTVRLVDLRHAKAHRAAAVDGGPTGRQVTVRFPVRGHWRRQAYGPKRGLRRSMYIAPFMKGPEGAPLKSGGTVPVVRVLQ
jgi:hypothetical protein